MWYILSIVLHIIIVGYLCHCIKYYAQLSDDRLMLYQVASNQANEATSNYLKLKETKIICDLSAAKQFRNELNNFIVLMESKDAEG